MWGALTTKTKTNCLDGSLEQVNPEQQRAHCSPVINTGDCGGIDRLLVIH
jgi:hypothetical protein